MIPYILDGKYIIMIMGYGFTHESKLPTNPYVNP